MSIIRVTDLSFVHDGSFEPVFEHVSFVLDTDWRLGFIGRNGRGKTTFLKLLMGEYPYQGKTDASVRFEYFPYDVKNPRRTTFEVAAQICPAAAPWEIARECNLLEIGDSVFARPFETLSPGEQAKILLAALFLREGQFLLIDEPTNHLDAHAREIVGNYLRAKSGFILVSHDRRFLDSCVDHILSINRTDIQIQKGNFSAWQKNRDEQERFEHAENEKLKKDVRRLRDAARRSAAWSDAAEKAKFSAQDSGLKPDRGYMGHKSAKIMRRAKALDARRQQAFEEKSKLLQNTETADDLMLRPLVHPAKRLAALRGVTLDYGGRVVVRDLNLEIRPGERIAICGKNGSGKSSILKLLAGEDISYRGDFSLAPGLVVSTVPQDTGGLSGSLFDFAKACQIDESLFLTILRKLGFSRAQFEKDLREYSAGQKKKVLLARSLCERAHLYLWDEPLNYVDILSRMQIERLILTYAPTMVFVEHDRAFVEQTATRCIEL